MAVQRRKKSKLIQAWVTPDLHAAIERMAVRRNTTVSELVRQLLWHAALTDALTPDPAAQAERVA